MDKVIGSIYTTDDLSIFKTNKMNSDLKMSHVNKMKESILKCGGVTGAIRVDEDFTIRDGHNRLKALELLQKEGKKFEVSYYFTINKNINEIDDLKQTNTVVNKKGNNELIQMYARAGDKNCIEIYSVATQLNVSPSLICKIGTKGRILGHISKYLEQGILKIENKEKVISFLKWYKTLPKEKLGIKADFDVDLLYRDFYSKSWFVPEYFEQGIEFEFNKNLRKKVPVEGNAKMKRDLFVNIYNGNRKKNRIIHMYNNLRDYSVELKNN